VSSAKAAAAASGPYLRSLPEQQPCSSPLLLPDRLLQEVQYAPAIAAPTAFQQFAQESYQQWHTAPALTAAAAAVSRLEGLVLGPDMVQSRSIRLAIAGCKVMIPGEAANRHLALLLLSVCNKL